MFDKDTQIYTDDCISDNEVAFIARPQENHNVRIVMTYISDEEEKTLRSLKELVVVRDNITFKINPMCCYHVGAYDFTPNNDTLKETHNLFKEYNVRHFIPSNWDYNTNTYTHTEKIAKWFDTSDPVEYLPYLYASINKPKKIVLFKEELDIDTIRLAREKMQKKKENRKKAIKERKEKAFIEKVKNSKIKITPKSIAKPIKAHITIK